MANISTRKRGKTWYYSFEAGATPDGKRKRFEKGGFSSEKEARNEGTKALASFLNGSLAIISKKITVQDFLSEWMERKAMEIKPKTLGNYQGLCKRVLPFLGKKNVQELRPRDIDGMLSQLAKEGLSHGTLSVILGMVKTALAYAVYPAELIQSNPAQYIKIPRNAPKNIIERHVIREDKLSELLESFPFGHPCHMPIMIAYHTGMRLGEVLGLAWDCVDLRVAEIAVKRQIVYTPESGYYFSTPKTASSIRTIRISDELVSLLKRWKSLQAENEVCHGKAYSYVYESSDSHLWQMHKQTTPDKGMVRRPLVCTQKNGKAVARSRLMVALYSHGTNFHSLRHTHATICAENGAPAKGIAGRLGHKNIAITENLYTHETERMQESTLDAFKKILTENHVS